MEISSNKSKILVNSIKPRPSTDKDEWKNAGRSGPAQIPCIHTNQRRNINKGSEDQTGATTLSHDKARMNTMEKHAVSFPTQIKSTRHLSCRDCSMDVRAWTLTADVERRINAFGNKCHRRMLAISYGKHTTKKYMCDMSTSSPDVRSFNCQPSSVASYHGSAVCRMLRCRRSYYREQLMAVVADEDLVNHEKTTSKNGQAGRCRHCCPSRMTDGQSSQQIHLSLYPNDTWLVS